MHDGHIALSGSPAACGLSARRSARAKRHRTRVGAGAESHRLPQARLIPGHLDFRPALSPYDESGNQLAEHLAEPSALARRQQSKAIAIERNDDGVRSREQASTISGEPKVCCMPRFHAAAGNPSVLFQRRQRLADTLGSHHHAASQLALAQARIVRKGRQHAELARIDAVGPEGDTPRAGLLVRRTNEEISELRFWVEGHEIGGHEVSIAPSGP